MKHFLPLFTLLLLTACMESDYTPEDRFVKFYGTSGSYELADMKPILDGSGTLTGFVLLATRDLSNALTGTDMYLFSVDTRGRIAAGPAELFVDRGEGNVYNETASRVSVTADGFLVVGTASIDGVNHIVWQSVGSNIPSGSITLQEIANADNAHMWGSDIIATTDGNILMVGSKIDPDDDDEDFFYTKIEPDGTPVFTRVQERNASTDRVIRVRERANGDFTLVGRTNAISGNGEGGVNVERTVINGTNGFVNNSLIYGMTTTSGTNVSINWNDEPSDIIIKAGGFAVVGTSTLGAGVSLVSYPFLLNVDLDGVVTEKKHFQSDFSALGLQGEGLGLTQSLSNDYVLVGRLKAFLDAKGNSRQDEGLMVRTDQGGTPVTDILNFGLENGNDNLSRVATLPDGTIIMAGTYDFGSGLKLLALVKVNSFGELK
jgi:hypothetical protein